MGINYPLTEIDAIININGFYKLERLALWSLSASRWKNQFDSHHLDSFILSSCLFIDL